MREKTIAGVNNALLADAGRRAAWEEVVAVAARAHDVPTPSRCAPAIGADDFRFAAVAVGTDGSFIGHHDPDLVRPAEWHAPLPLRRQLAGCEEVAVLALPPWLGIAPIFESQTPWHYVLGPAHRPAAAQPRHVVVASPTTPEEVDLAPLPQRALPELDGTGEVIQGVAATPERVLAAISDATLVEIHSHATWLPQYDAPVLALSRGSDSWTLGAAQIRSANLRAAPVVVLAACEGALAARYEHATWGLPQVFRIAGASAVIAPGVAVPDKDASDFFDAVVREISGGAAPARAVAHVRSQKMRNGAPSWMRHVLVLRIDLEARWWSEWHQGSHDKLPERLLREDTLVVPLAILGWSFGRIKKNGKSTFGVVTAPGAAPTPLPDGGSGGMQMEGGEVARLLVEAAEMLVSIPR